ncbi:MAG: hypothetical protein A2X66_09195 [Ignavibacteria bacterium GWA2_54_16]|nr:MAG: hypothetical protein A2X66_09195 [Ignavibacteria bacterium GWA2_54_16]
MLSFLRDWRSDSRADIAVKVVEMKQQDVISYGGRFSKLRSGDRLLYAAINLRILGRLGSVAPDRSTREVRLLS